MYSPHKISDPQQAFYAKNIYRNYTYSLHPTKSRLRFSGNACVSETISLMNAQRSRSVKRFWADRCTKLKSKSKAFPAIILFCPIRIFTAL